MCGSAHFRRLKSRRETLPSLRRREALLHPAFMFQRDFSHEWRQAYVQMRSFHESLQVLGITFRGQTDISGVRARHTKQRNQLWDARRGRQLRTHAKAYVTCVYLSHGIASTPIDSTCQPVYHEAATISTSPNALAPRVVTLALAPAAETTAPPIREGRI